ncbi:MAG: hypothetical protein ACE5Q6_06815 [Dehalococcoidia bacterium]
MTSGKRRLDKLEGHLTPRQAALMWMNDAHQFGTMTQYADSLKGGPESAWPIPRLCNQMEASVSQAMKGRPKIEIRQALRQADLDVLFLFFLHQKCNSLLMERERYYSTYSLMLSKQLGSLAREQMWNDEALWNRMLVGLRLPYPLDPETVAAVEGAIEHYVMPWEVLEESDDLSRWVTNSFLAEGKDELPDDAYRLQHDYSGSLPGPDPEEVQALFPDQESFDKFLAGEDYNYGLADVTDEEYNERYETIMSAIRDLGLEGSVMELPPVPHAFLREAPLVDGEWIDRYVVELAEWGARLVQQGLAVEESDDPHALAWFNISDPEAGENAPAEMTLKLWQQAQRHLARSPGRTKEIEGHHYFNWEDYLGWRGRRVKGDLTARISQGLIVSQWNRWVEQQGGEGKATLAGVLVDRLSCHAEGYQHQVCQDAGDLDKEQRQRRSLLETLWLNKPNSKSEERFNERARNWKELARDFLLELYTLRQVIDSINQRYFEGHQVLFTKVAQGFKELVDHTERLVDLYSSNLSEELDRLATLLPEGDSEKSEESFHIDLPTLEELSGKSTRHQVAYLVDMAKVEALDTMGENRKAVELLDRHV